MFIVHGTIIMCEFAFYTFLHSSNAHHSFCTEEYLNDVVIDFMCLHELYELALKVQANTMMGHLDCCYFMLTHGAHWMPSLDVSGITKTAIILLIWMAILYNKSIDEM